MKRIMTYQHGINQVYWCKGCMEWHRHRNKNGPADAQCDTARSVGRGRVQHRPPEKIELVCVGPIPHTLVTSFGELISDMPPALDINALLE